MKRRLTNAILVPAISLVFANVALAQLQDNLELNVFGGGSFYTDNKFEVSFPQSTLPIQETFRFNKSLRGGVRVGVYTRGHWSEEFFYSYDPTTAHFIRRSPPANSVNLRFGVNNYGITTLYYLKEDESHSIRPFLSIGVGGAFYRLTPEADAIARDPLRGNIPGITNSNLLTMNYGVGVKTRSSGWLGFRADLRGFLGPTPTFGLPHKADDPNATVFPASGPLHNGEASAGLVFYFFRKR